MSEGEIMEVLLVEDNPQDAELMLRALQRHNLADGLVHVEDGAQALDFLFGRGQFEGRPAGAAPGLILLDLKLPRMNGLEVLTRMKTHAHLRTIPVVVVTSSAEHPDVRAAYELGANGYVIKPVRFDTFIEAMSKVGMYWLQVNCPPR